MLSVLPLENVDDITSVLPSKNVVGVTFRECRRYYLWRMSSVLLLENVIGVAFGECPRLYLWRMSSLHANSVLGSDKVNAE